MLAVFGKLAVDIGNGTRKLTDWNRIEDNIYVTENGYENLTAAIKEVSEVEAVAAK
jgi:hypothetical protein